MLEDQCKIEYENRIPKAERTNYKWTLWCLAWNAAIRTAANVTNRLRVDL